MASYACGSSGISATLPTIIATATGPTEPWRAPAAC